jgi:hypothetical protein
VISDLDVGIGAPLDQYGSADAYDIVKAHKTGRNKNKSTTIVLGIELVFNKQLSI